MSFEQRFVRSLPFGSCVGVALPSAPADEPATEALPAALHPDEAAFVETLPPARRASWIGGRVALRAALASLGLDASAPILATPRGAPVLPAGIVGSISHKRALAVALAAPAASAPGATLGIDVEEVRALRQDIARHVLTQAERDALEAGPGRDAEVLRLFSAKEAIYKALDPWVRRFVSFQEVEIAGRARGGLAARLALAGREGPFVVELHDASRAADGVILVAARIARASG